MFTACFASAHNVYSGRIRVSVGLHPAQETTIQGGLEIEESSDLKQND